MTIGNQAEWEDQAAVAIEEAVAWHSVAIISDNGQAIGTGVAAPYGPHHVFITAAHVVAGQELQSLQYLFRPTGPLVWAELAEVSSRRAEVVVTPRETVVIERVLTDDVLDLAFLLVPPELKNRSRIRFFELGKDSLTPPEGTTIRLRGYPSDVALPMGGTDKLVLPAVVWGTIDNKRPPEKFDPKTEFLVPYAFAEVGKHARGFSGAGAWFHDSPTAVWHPNLGLAGICTAY